MKHALKAKIEVISVALYPGRKQWFVKQAARFFRAHPCETLIEPFAGSAVVGFSLLHAGLIKHLVLVEKDERIVCMLKGLITEPNLADRYARFECTKSNVQRLMRKEKSAFRYLVQSRCSNRGKFSGGLRTAIDSRWCRDMVVTNLGLLYEMRDRITVIQSDGLAVMRAHSSDETVGCFADPPYTAGSTSKGTSLYRHHRLNHKRLFSLLANWRGPWLMTQDNCRLVRRLALCHRFHTRRIRMNTSDNIIKHELAIWRNRPMF